MQGRVFVFAVFLAVSGLSGCRWDNQKPSSASGGPVTSPATAGNRSPVIGGTPTTTAAVNSSYSFQPTASDPDGNPLTFRIVNKPAWASFDPATGRLYGTPSSTSGGTFAGIQITVTDGQASASLPAFSITVANTAVIGSATLNWQPPTMNADGTSLGNLAGYKVRYGASPASLSQTVSIGNPGVTTYVIDNLAAGTWYFVLTAVNSAGIESNPTAAVSMTIG
jgi:hypothetical protein